MANANSAPLGFISFIVQLIAVGRILRLSSWSLSLSKALQPLLRSSCEPTATAALSYGPSFLCETTVGKITRFCPT